MNLLTEVVAKVPRQTERISHYRWLSTAGIFLICRRFKLAIPTPRLKGKPRSWAGLNNQLQLKACTADLTLAKETGATPLYIADDNMSWESNFPPQHAPRQVVQGIRSSHNTLAVPGPETG